MNNGNGALSRLVSMRFGNSIKKMVVNLENSSNEFSKFTVK
jgi:phospholipid/cholesterol/gamma-HCH transport system substrate-binding protein